MTMTSECLRQHTMVSPFAKGRLRINCSAAGEVTEAEALPGSGHLGEPGHFSSALNLGGPHQSVKTHHAALRVTIYINVYGTWWSHVLHGL